MAGQKRTKTKYTNIYFNEDTKKYDVKYNFKEYNPVSQKNVYRAKWKYNLMTLAEARQELAKMQTGDMENIQRQSETIQTDKLKKR